MIIKKIKKALKNPKLIVSFLLNKKTIAKLFPDKVYLRLKYCLEMGKKLNLKNPETFNEKLQWLKLYNRKPEYTMMADKVEVRKYIAEKLGEEYLIPCLGVWDNPEDIDFESLPNQFVLKCNHNSGTGMIICKDKSKLDIKKAKKELKKGLKENYYLLNREWPYKNIKPRIIAEKYMVDESGTELKDYKFFCFDGKVELIQVDYGRFKEHKRNLYTLDWEFVNAQIQFPNDENYIINKPVQLKKMCDIASELSNGIPHVRIDLYSIESKIYFGELTFYHGSGVERFYPKELEYKLGEMINLERVDN